MKKRYVLIPAVLTAGLLMAAFAGELKELLTAQKGTVTVDFEKNVGEIRELNGINNGPNPVTPQTVLLISGRLTQQKFISVLRSLLSGHMIRNIRTGKISLWIFTAYFQSFPEIRRIRMHMILPARISMLRQSGRRAHKFCFVLENR